MEDVLSWLFKGGMNVTRKNGAPYQEEMHAAVRAAREAGEMIRRHAGTIRQEDVRTKGVNDLVTVVDENVQEHIIRTLEETFPNSRFLAEEGEDFSSEGDGGYLWIIDPIDGTTNFTHGVPPYAVSIALRDGEDLAVAVVFDAASGDLFTASRGGGLYLNGERRRVSRTERLEDSLVTTGFPYREMAHLESYLGVLGEFMRRSRGVRRPGSAAVDLAYVAVGRFDGFFETGLRPWDVAAGILMIEEGGGRATDYRDRSRPIFERQILASNGLIHSEMLRLVHPMRDIYL